MKIIGVTGTLAAGKGTIVEYLIEKKGFSHYSVRAFLIEEIEKRNLPVDRDSMREVANDLRTTHHPAYIVEQLYLQAKRAGKDAIIESIRAVGEVEALKKYADFLLLAVDADQQLRYQRALLRANESDHVDFSTFQGQEKAEMDNQDPSKQNISVCMHMADISIRNDAKISDLYRVLDEYFS